MFCYRCCRVGHGETHYNFASNQQHEVVHSMPPVLVVQELVSDERAMQLDGASKEQDGSPETLKIIQIWFNQMMVKL